ncbi:HIRAN domain-containing protein [Ornithinibacillus scapharcae]|uniref:HIRAN domain-containing protein n=1 Tax=Ornithinibacillus scapharcae TaxID=1147159 RepID=UPI000225B427|nr:HIRAN domain-containing protein [Ornithinibacillus scapharcae]
MRYVNQYEIEGKEFKSFIYECIGKKLKPETVKMRGWIREFTLYKKDLPTFEQIMENSFIKSYKIIEGVNTGSETIEVKYLEQYPINDKKEEERFRQVNEEMWDIEVNSWGQNLNYENMHEFDEIVIGKRFSYFILDKKYEEDARNIVKHVLDMDIEVNHVDIVSDKFEINGLIWFKINNFYNEDVYPSYKVLSVLSKSNINHCIYQDMDGSLSLDIRMKARDSRESHVKFRDDLKLVFNSSWEANIARLLNYLGIKWEYERESYFVESDHFSHYYIPDFFLDNNTLIEVKGFWDNESLKKVSLFKEQHKEHKLLTIDSDMYYTLDKMYKKVIPEWEKASVLIKRERLPVVGVTRPERRKFVSNVKIGDNLFLIRDEDNPYDRNAILVVDNDDNEIGFIAKDWASIYADKLDVGMKFNAVVEQKEAKVIKIVVERININDINSLYEFLK